MSEMVERVARAIFAHCPELEGDFDDYGSLVQERYLEKARAAIEAMREPTEAMELAAENADETGRAGPAEHWRAMIDDALK